MKKYVISFDASNIGQFAMRYTILVNATDYRDARRKFEDMIDNDEIECARGKKIIEDVSVSYLTESFI